MNVHCGPDIHGLFLLDPGRVLDPFLGSLNKTVLQVISRMKSLKVF